MSRARLVEIAIWMKRAFNERVGAGADAVEERQKMKEAFFGACVEHGLDSKEARRLMRRLI